MYMNLVLLNKKYLPITYSIVSIAMYNIQFENCTGSATTLTKMIMLLISSVKGAVNKIMGNYGG